MVLILSPSAVRAAEPEREVADRVVKLTNAFRKQNQKPPLKVNPRLTKAAQQHAQNMAAQETMAHELDGKTPGDRIRATGYLAGLSGENVATASGKEDPARTMLSSWKQSKPHRANMLGEEQDFTQIGVGVAVSSSGTVYGCQVFAKPKGQK